MKDGRLINRAISKKHTLTASIVWGLVGFTMDHNGMSYMFHMDRLNLDVALVPGLDDPDATLAETRTADRCSFRFWSTYTTASNFAMCLSFGLLGKSQYKSSHLKSSRSSRKRE